MTHVRMYKSMSLKNEEPRKRPGERNPHGGNLTVEGCAAAKGAFLQTMEDKFQTFGPRALLERELHRRFGFIAIGNADFERRLDLPFCRLQELCVIESLGLHVINNNCTIVVFF